MSKKPDGALRSLLAAVLKIGLIGFGGGSALIPVIHKNLVEDKKLVTSEEYEEDVMIASVTPGALPVEISGCIGKRIAGWKGMLLGAAGMALPGVFLTVLLLSFISYVDEEVLRQIQYFAVGITAFIACLLTDYVKGTVKKTHIKEQKWQNLLIILLVFVLTCGKNVFRIFGIAGKPLVSLSNIQIFGVAFLVLIIVHLVQWFGKLLRKSGAESEEKGCRGSFFSEENLGQMKRELTALIVVLIVTGTFAFLVTNQSLAYLWNGFLSSVMSFGGGDAYLTVAEGLFVETTLISEDAYYGQLVPLVNVLPGSILCKTLSGIGFYLGFRQAGSLWAGYVVALAGFACSIFGSCGVVSIAGCFYKSFEDLAVFRSIRRWIRPIVAGLMLNVILSLVYQNCKMGMLPVILMVGIYVLDTFLYQYKKVGNGKIALLSIALSVVICNIAMMF
ncbi:MAG: chromate transporter [Lachnospiraceae bacterium]|nr:chromate transporter [Lachnospiraceae bacterium]